MFAISTRLITQSRVILCSQFSYCKLIRNMKLKILDFRFFQRETWNVNRKYHQAFRIQGNISLIIKASLTLNIRKITIEFAD